ncbi:MAG: hypothetical protein Kow0037_11710 [Calditrichia bacterium]
MTVNHLILRKLKKSHRSLFLLQLFRDGMSFLGGLLLYFLAFFGLQQLFEVSGLVRWLFFSGMVVAVLWWLRQFAGTAIREVIAPSLTALERTALQAGYADSQIKDILINYLQLSREKNSGSDLLREKALEQLLGRISGKIITVQKDWRGIRKASWLLSLPMAAFLLLAYFWPGEMQIAAQKMLLPWKTIKTPPPIQLINLSGEQTVLKNEPVKLKGRFVGEFPARLEVVLVEEGRSPEQEHQAFTLPYGDGGTFEYEIQHVYNSFTYFFRARLNHPKYHHREFRSELARVKVQSRPYLRSRQIKITPPAYTGLKAFLHEEGTPDILALKGSRLGIRIQADRMLSAAKIEFSNGKSLDCRIAGNEGVASFPIYSDLSFQIHVWDVDSVDNDERVNYRITPIPDEYPFAEIKQPGGDVDLGEDLTVPLFAEYQDDFGFSRADIEGVVVRNGSGGDSLGFQQPLKIKRIKTGKAFSELLWDLTPFYMVPDDFVKYRVRIWDNDRVSGPKMFATQYYTIRLPSLLEMMDQLENQQDRQIKEIKEVANVSKELKKEIEELHRELKKQGDLSWEKRQEAKNQLNRQKEALEKLQKVQDELQKLTENLDKQNMLSPETLEKYFELQKMVEKLATPELKKAMEELQKALEKADPNALKNAMQKFQLSVEEFERNVERAYELFKRVELEQQMDELVRLAEKMREMQEQINKKLKEEKLSAEEKKQLAKQEEQQGEQADYLKDQLKKTQQSYRELLQQNSEMLEKSRQFMDEKKLAERMEQMAEQMQMNELQAAQQSGEQLQSDLDNLQNMLQSARQNMMQSQKQQIAREMQRAMDELLEASFKQEALYDKTKSLSAASPQLTRIAKKQSDLLRQTRSIIGQLVRISQKTFFLSPQLNQQMAAVMKNMQTAIEALEERQTSRSSQGQARAMTALNVAMMLLQNSQNQMQQASSASGFQEFMQQMQQMAGQQGQLNQQTMGMFQQAQSGRRQLTADDLGRLAAQQEMIRQSMEELARQTGNRKDVLGRLGDMAREMEEVAKRLRAQKLDRKLIERQQKILSRMLDAQRSIREKEYSKKRKAEWESPQITKSPPQLKREVLRREDYLKKLMLEALEEGYSSEYQEFIRRYYQELSQEPLEIKE